MQKISRENRLEISFLSLPENERIGRTLAAAFAAVLDPTMEELCDFKTAVSEAVTNAIIHAYPESCGEIQVNMKRENNRLDVIVTDYGAGIEDVVKCMQPLYSTIKGGERSGMGFTFMEAFTDHMSVVSRPGKGTTVFLTKYLHSIEDKKEENHSRGPHL